MLFPDIMREEFEDQICHSVSVMFINWDKYKNLDLEECTRILYVIVRNNLINHLKKKEVERQWEKDFESLYYDEYTDAESEHAIAQKTRWIRLRMNELQDKESDIIHEHYFNNLRFKEIALKIGKSEKAVQKQHERIILRLKELSKDFTPPCK